MRKPRMSVAIKTITAAVVVTGASKIFGLGYDNKMYYWTNDGWRLLTDEKAK